MKKLTAVFVAFLILFGLTSTAYAGEFTGRVASQAVILCDADSGEVIYSKDENETIYPASTTKLLTVLVTLENVSDLSETVTVSGDALDGIDEEYDSTLQPMLCSGEEISVKDLLYGMLLESGNDAAAAIAYYISGSIEDFAYLMNEKAEELGMLDSNFVNPHGKHDEGHYSTAADMMKLARAAYANETVMQIVGTAEYEIPETNVAYERYLSNTNQLIEKNEYEDDYRYSYATGMKTGWSEKAGSCLIASASKDDRNLICVIYGGTDADDTERWTLSKELFDFAFEKSREYSAKELFSNVPLNIPVDYADNYDVIPNFDGITVKTAKSLDDGAFSAGVNINTDEEEKPINATVLYYGSDGKLLAEVPASVVRKEAPVEEKETGFSIGTVLKLIGIVIGAVIVIFVIFLLAVRFSNIAKHRRKEAMRREANRRQMNVDTSDEYTYRTNSNGTERSTRKRSSFVKRYLMTILFIAVIVILIAVIALSLSRCGAEKEEETKELPTAEEAAPTDPASTYGFSPAPTEKTAPSALGISWNILKADTGLNIGFSDDDYYSKPGIVTFRGNNFRNGGSYGTSQINEEEIYVPLWTVETSSLLNSEGTGAWTGSGWTGQPLIITWSGNEKQNINFYEEYQNSDTLTEVIYATLDGHIYFIDFETGEFTRDPLNIGMCFKGAGSLDPRGYPLMYVGSGDATSEGKRPRIYIISLVDCTVLFTYGDNDPDAMREDNDSWTAFDSSPLIDAESDTLIWPGENGIFYIFKLNTQYNESTGALSVSPEIVSKASYSGPESSAESHWLGFESSVAVIDHYAYVSENGGMMFCIDLNTMELVWAQNTKDDSNSTPVIDYDAKTGTGYVYTAPSLHWTAEDGYGQITIYKLNAENGEIVWQKSYECYTEEGVSGGVQATPVLGKKGTDLENMILYPIARTPNAAAGELVALDTETGEEIWNFKTDAYSWSSPVAVYNDDGTGYIIFFDSEGYGYLLDGSTGEQIDYICTDSLIEASPIVYNDTVIIGTRKQEILAFKLS